VSQGDEWEGAEGGTIPGPATSAGYASYMRAHPRSRELDYSFVTGGKRRTNEWSGPPASRDVKSLALYFEKQYSGSLEAARTGANLNPNSAFSFFGMGQAEIALSWPEAGPGRCEEGLLHIKEAFRLSPRDPLTGIWHMQSGLAQFCLERLDTATEEISQGIDAGYRTFNIYGALASIEAIRGNESEAKAALAEALRLNPQLTIKRVEQIWKDRPPFFDGLRKAGLPEE
jgi:adenylate cyclase